LGYECVVGDAAAGIGLPMSTPCCADPVSPVVMSRKPPPVPPLAAGLAADASPPCCCGTSCSPSMAEIEASSVQSSYAGRLIAPPFWTERTLSELESSSS
jgi:hypothetical protein